MLNSSIALQTSVLTFFLVTCLTLWLFSCTVLLILLMRMMTMCRPFKSDLWTYFFHLVNMYRKNVFQFWLLKWNMNKYTTRKQMWFTATSKTWSCTRIITSWKGNIPRRFFILFYVKIGVKYILYLWRKNFVLGRSAKRIMVFSMTWKMLSYWQYLAAWHEPILIQDDWCLQYAASITTIPKLAFTRTPRILNGKDFLHRASHIESV